MGENRNSEYEQAFPHKRILGIFNGLKKVVVSADRVYATPVGRVNHFDGRDCHCAVHLHAFLDNAQQALVIEFLPRGTQSTSHYLFFCAHNGSSHGI